MKNYLLVYDRRRGALLRSAEELPSNVSAIRERRRLEFEYAARPEVEVVVLTARSEDDLRRTHSRFFSGLQEMTDHGVQQFKSATSRASNFRARMAG